MESQEKQLTSITPKFVAYLLKKLTDKEASNTLCQKLQELVNKQISENNPLQRFECANLVIKRFNSLAKRKQILKSEFTIVLRSELTL
jgi:phosphoglycerol transferase MdoB-like AlkP superfamily enzyme